jgi:hypothetical protein
MTPQSVSVTVNLALCSCGGDAVFALALEDVGAAVRLFEAVVFGPVVAADERWSWVEACELVRLRQDFFGVASPAYPDGQAESSVLVDHVEELQAAAISGGIELEVHGPDLVWVLTLVPSHRDVSRACPLMLAGR